MIQVESERDFTIVTVFGDIDVSAITYLGRMFGYIDLAMFVVVSFKKHRHVDSSIVQLLLAQHDARKGRLIVVAPSDSAAGRVLTFARLHANRLSVVDRHAEAVTMIGSRERLTRASFATDTGL